MIYTKIQGILDCNALNLDLNLQFKQRVCYHQNGLLWMVSFEPYRKQTKVLFTRVFNGLENLLSA